MRMLKMNAQSKEMKIVLMMMLDSKSNNNNHNKKIKIIRVNRGRDSKVVKLLKRMSYWVLDVINNVYQIEKEIKFIFKL